MKSCRFLYWILTFNSTFLGKQQKIHPISNYMDQFKFITQIKLLQVMGGSISTNGSGINGSKTNSVNTNSPASSSPSSPLPNLFSSKNPVSKITSKLSKSDIVYHISDLKGYYDEDTLTSIIKETIEQDKKEQLSIFIQKSKDKDVSKFKYQYKPKIFITDIKTLDVAKVFVPSVINPYGFVHTCLKIGPIVCFIFF